MILEVYLFGALLGIAALLSVPTLLRLLVLLVFWVVGHLVAWLGYGVSLRTLQAKWIAEDKAAYKRARAKLYANDPEYRAYIDGTETEEVKAI